MKKYVNEKVIFKLQNHNDNPENNTDAICPRCEHPCRRSTIVKEPMYRCKKSNQRLKV